MRQPYRVAIWGPGDVGSICARELIRLPETELVAAFAYSEAKIGQDIGTLAGLDPIGVKVTGELAAFLAVDCDVVLHTALDFPGATALDDFVTLLEAGKNVITSHPYNNLDARDPSFRQRLEAAAAQVRGVVDGRQTLAAGRRARSAAAGAGTDAEGLAGAGSFRAFAI